MPFVRAFPESGCVSSYCSRYSARSWLYRDHRHDEQGPKCHHMSFPIEIYLFPSWEMTYSFQILKFGFRSENEIESEQTDQKQDGEVVDRGVIDVDLKPWNMPPNGSESGRPQQHQHPRSSQRFSSKKSQSPKIRMLQKNIVS